MEPATEPTEQMWLTRLRAHRGQRVGLSGKLLFLTILFVMVAEILIYVPSIANFRLNWLNDRLAAAHTAALVLDAAPSGMVPESLAKQILKSIGARAVAMKMGTQRRLLAASEMPSADRAGHRHAQRCRGGAPSIDAFDTLFLRARRRHPRGRAGADGRRFPRNHSRRSAAAQGDADVLGEHSCCCRWRSPASPRCWCSLRCIICWCARCGASPPTWSRSAPIRKIRRSSLRKPAAR